MTILKQLQQLTFFQNESLDFELTEKKTFDNES